MKEFNLNFNYCSLKTKVKSENELTKAWSITLYLEKFTVTFLPMLLTYVCGRLSSIVSYVKPYFRNKLASESSAACVTFKRIKCESEKTSKFSLTSLINNLFKVN